MSSEGRAAAENYLDDSRQEDALKLLINTVGRAKALRQPVIVKADPDSRAFIDLQNYRIALIPMTVAVKSGDRCFPDGGNSQGRTTGRTYYLKRESFDHFDICVPDVERSGYEEEVSSWCDDIFFQCKSVLKKKQGCPPVRYVLFGELSFPNFWPGRSRVVSEYDLRRRLNELRNNLDQRLQALATRHQAVIMSGTYHDSATFENIACIYFPNAKFTRYHSKLTSAQAVLEHIKVARSVQYPIYNVGDCRFAVLICSDAFDLNIFFEQLSGSKNPAIRPNIYFVPSFYVEKHDGQNRILDACKQLSLATGKIVVFVNQSAGADCAAAFIAGEKQNLSQGPGLSRYLTVDQDLVQGLLDKSGEIRNRLEQMFSR